MKMKIVQLIHRQMSLPLIGNEQALQTISEILSEYFSFQDAKLIDPENLQIKYQKGLEKRAVRMIFEEQLFSDDDDEREDDDDENEMKISEVNSNNSNTKMIRRRDIWKAYIKFELNDKEIFRAQRLYERAVKDLPIEYNLWSEYIEFAVSTIKNWSLIEVITRNGLEIPSLQSDAYIWILHILSLENNHKIEAADQIIEVIQKAMIVTLPSADDYLDIQYSLIDFYLRQFKQTNSKHPEIDITYMDTALHNSLNQVEYLLNTYYPTWASGWLRHYKYSCHVEEFLYKKLHDLPDQNEDINISSSSSLSLLNKKARSVWEAAITKYGTYQYIWMEYIDWVKKSEKNYEYIRKLFNRAIHTVHDEKMYMARQWILFEREYGNLKDILQSMIKWKELYNTQLSSSKVDSQITSVSSQPANNQGDTSNKRKLNKISESDETKKKRNVEIDVVPNSESSNPEPIPSSDSIVTSSASDNNLNPQNVLEKNKNMILVRNLPFTTEESQIAKYFADYGLIRKISLVLSKSGKSRGMAVIEFDNTHSIDSALSIVNPDIEGRQVIIERLTDKRIKEHSIYLFDSISTSNSNKMHNNELNAVTDTKKSNQHPTTIFVSKLPLDMTSDGLKELFQVFGEILEAKIAINKQTGESKVS
jgi:RNA recognition motif-containing protein